MATGGGSDRLCRVGSSILLVILISFAILVSSSSEVSFSTSSPSSGGNSTPDKTVIHLCLGESHWNRTLHNCVDDPDDGEPLLNSRKGLSAAQERMPNHSNSWSSTAAPKVSQTGTVCIIVLVAVIFVAALCIMMHYAEHFFVPAPHSTGLLTARETGTLGTLRRMMHLAPQEATSLRPNPVVAPDAQDLAPPLPSVSQAPQVEDSDKSGVIASVSEPVHSNPVSNVSSA